MGKTWVSYSLAAPICKEAWVKPNNLKKVSSAHSDNEVMLTMFMFPFHFLFIFLFVCLFVCFLFCFVLFCFVFFLSLFTAQIFRGSTFWQNIVKKKMKGLCRPNMLHLTTPLGQFVKGIPGTIKVSLAKITKIYDKVFSKTLVLNITYFQIWSIIYLQRILLIVTEMSKMQLFNKYCCVLLNTRGIKIDFNTNRNTVHPFIPTAHEST